MKEATMYEYFDDDDELLGAEALTALQFMHEDLDLGHADEIERERRARGLRSAGANDHAAAGADFDFDQDFDAALRSALRESMAIT
jgi:hypothetical protein